MTQQRPQSVLDDPLDALASQPDASSAIDAWLAVFARLMRLPEPTRQSIRMELREHLRERVRDLLLSSGSTLIDERDAVRTAVEELGETAELARRFEAANQSHRRRILMHAALLAAGAGAIIAGVVTFSQPGANSANPVAASRFETADTVQQPPKSLTDARVAIGPETSLRDALAAIVEQAKVGLIVDWNVMDNNGINSGDPLGISFTGVAAGDALTMIAEAASVDQSQLDWRARDGAIEFGLRQALDRREIELVTYDITATINLIAADFAENKEEASEQIINLLTHLVEADNWRDNGGDMAQVMLVGGRLFVEAPSRMHTKIKWILDQLPNMPGNKPQVNADGEGVPMLKDLPLMGEMFAANAPVRRILNPGDSVTVNVFELYQPGVWATSTRTIDEIGMLRVSEVGDIRAAGLTVPALLAEIERRIDAKAILKHPKVDVVLETGGAR